MEEGEHQYNVVKVGQILLWKWQIQKFLTQILGQDRDSCPGGARLGRSEQCPQWIQTVFCVLASKRTHLTCGSKN